MAVARGPSLIAASDAIASATIAWRRSSAESEDEPDEQTHDERDGGDDQVDHAISVSLTPSWKEAAR
jgi:hypothetical protein